MLRSRSPGQLESNPEQIHIYQLPKLGSGQEHLCCFRWCFVASVSQLLAARLLVLDSDFSLPPEKTPNISHHAVSKQWSTAWLWIHNVAYTQRLILASRNTFPIIMHGVTLFNSARRRAIFSAPFPMAFTYPTLQTCWSTWQFLGLPCTFVPLRRSSLASPS